MMSQEELIDKVLIWIRINTDVEGIDYYKFLSILSDAIENKLQNNT